MTRSSIRRVSIAAGRPAFAGLRERLWRYAGAVPLRSKIMGIVLWLVLVLGVGITWQVRQTLESRLTDELRLRSISIATDMAARSADYVLTNNLFALHQLAQETLANNPDVRYAFVIDRNGEVLVHTFGSRFPGDLIGVHGRTNGSQVHLVLLDSDEGPLVDAAAPVFEGRSGAARVGLSQRRVQAAVTAITAELLLATAFVSLLAIGAAYMLTRLLTAPVQDLVRVTYAIEAGDIGRRAGIWADDEIGRLGHAFNAMISRLESMQRDLLRRNEELEARNVVAAAVSATLALDAVLDRAIDVVLATTDFDAGGILLWDPAGGGLCYRVHRGLSPGFVEGVAGLQLGEGIAGRVAETGELMVIDDLSTDLRITRPAARTEGLRAFVSVPLRAGDEVVGVLNVGSRESRAVDDATRQLLTAIGTEVGVAVQNARLWEELKQKEAMRGYLLQRIMSAQEEERRRIARELHDETSQALTTVMVGLRLLVEEQSGGSTARADELRGVVGGALDAVHALLLELRPSALDDIGLAAALQRYTREYARKHGLVVDFQAGGLDGDRLPSEVETTAYRIVQEALMNVARHADARSVSLLVERRDGHLIAVIEDDGRGFDVVAVERATDGERHFGLAGMRERAVLVGGTLTVESQPGTGTAVFVDLPLTGGGARS